MDLDESTDCARHAHHVTSLTLAALLDFDPSSIDALVNDSFGSASESSIAQLLGVSNDGRIARPIDDVSHLWPVPPPRASPSSSRRVHRPSMPALVEHSALGIVVPFWPTPSVRTRQSSWASVLDGDEDGEREDAAFDPVIAPPPSPMGAETETKAKFLARRFASIGLWPSPNPDGYLGPSLELSEPTPRPSPVIVDATDVAPVPSAIGKRPRSLSVGWTPVTWPPMDGPVKRARQHSHNGGGVARKTTPPKAHMRPVLSPRAPPSMPKRCTIALPDPGAFDGDVWPSFGFSRSVRAPIWLD